METVEYRHHLFSWERRIAASGVRRLKAQGDPRGFLAFGLEAYGYLLCAAVWGTAAGILAIFVEFPMLVIQGGATLASWIVVIVVVSLCSMAFVRGLQSKEARKVGRSSA